MASRAAEPAGISADPGVFDARMDPGVRRAALVLPVAELRWLSRTWLALGLIVLGADLASGSVGRLSLLEIAGSCGLLALSVAGSVAGMMLGLRTGPEMLYAQIFDRAPLPPGELELEAQGSTASRAGWAAIGVAICLSIGAPMGTAVVLVLTGTPAASVLDHLPAASALVAAGWILACSASADQLRRWFARWERRRDRVLICGALSSGRLAPVYYSAPRRAGDPRPVRLGWG
jgi:hypothetical protein